MTRVMILHSLNGLTIHCHVIIFLHLTHETLASIFMLLPHLQSFIRRQPPQPPWKASFTHPWQCLNFHHLHYEHEHVSAIAASVTITRITLSVTNQCWLTICEFINVEVATKPSVNEAKPVAVHDTSNHSAICREAPLSAPSWALYTMNNITIAVHTTTTAKPPW